MAVRLVLLLFLAGCSYLPEPLNNPTFSDDRLRGSTLGDIRTDDAAKRPYTLVFDLNLRWNVLNGSVSAISKPGPRLGNALSHWCELEKDPNR